jgi:hypothetical protein
MTYQGTYQQLNPTDKLILTKAELCELLEREINLTFLAGTKVSLDALELTLQDWRCNLLFRVYPRFLLQSLQKRL